MTGVVEEFIDGLRAGEPRAVEAANRLLGTMAHKHPPGRRRLRPREQQVMERMAVGMRDAQIALELGIREHTVKGYVRNAMVALGARTRPHAVVLWLLRGAK